MNGKMAVKIGLGEVKIELREIKICTLARGSLLCLQNIYIHRSMGYTVH